MDARTYAKFVRIGKMGGRPVKMENEATRHAFEHSLVAGASRIEACTMAGISFTALRTYIKKHPEYEQKIQDLRKYRRLKAKLNTFAALEAGDVKVSQWELEKTDPEYQKQSSDVNINVGFGMVLQALKNDSDVIEITDGKDG